jgi:hypothetical protein
MPTQSRVRLSHVLCWHIATQLRGEKRADYVDHPSLLDECMAKDARWFSRKELLHRKAMFHHPRIRRAVHRCATAPMPVAHSIGASPGESRLSLTCGGGPCGAVGVPPLRPMDSRGIALDCVGT